MHQLRSHPPCPQPPGLCRLSWKSLHTSPIKSLRPGLQTTPPPPLQSSGHGFPPPRAFQTSPREAQALESKAQFPSGNRRQALSSSVHTAFWTVELVAASTVHPACSRGRPAPRLEPALDVDAHSSPTQFSHEPSLPCSPSPSPVLSLHRAPRTHPPSPPILHTPLRFASISSRISQYSTCSSPHPSNSSTPKGWASVCPQDKDASAPPCLTR